MSFTNWVEIYFQPALSTLMMGKTLLYTIWQVWLCYFWNGYNTIIQGNVYVHFMCKCCLYFGVCMLYSLCSRKLCMREWNLDNTNFSTKHLANLTVRPVRNSCQRQPLPRWYGMHIHEVLGILQSWYLCFMPEIGTIDLSEIYWPQEANMN